MTTTLCDWCGDPIRDDDPTPCPMTDDGIHVPAGGAA